MKERTRQAPDKTMPQVGNCEDSQDAQPSQEKKHVSREKVRRPPEKAQLSQDIQRRIGLQLRAMYTDVVNEGVPDRFADLLRRLDKQDKQ
jgi:Anti-sigma factor NepR